jgi:hypothetical protein
MKKVKSIFLLTFFSLLLFSCTKEGPAGPPGAQGEQGSQGPQGAQGPTGNANVQTINFTFDLSTLPSSASSYEFDCKNSAITTDIVNKGAILGYLEVNATTNDWTALPTWAFPAGGQMGYRVYVSPGSYAVVVKMDNGNPVQKSYLPIPFVIKVTLFP